MTHKTDPDSDLADPRNLGPSHPEHDAGCAALGIDGPPGQRFAYLEDERCCDCSRKRLHP